MLHLFLFGQLCKLLSNFLFLLIVDAGPFLISLFFSILDDHMRALLSLSENSLFHFLDSFLDASHHHYDMISIIAQLSGIVFIQSSSLLGLSLDLVF